MDTYDKLVEALEILQAIRDSDCEEFLPLEIRERIEVLMPESSK